MFYFSGLFIAGDYINIFNNDWPKWDCTIDCNFCNNNVCKSCTYGYLSEKERCLPKQIFLNAEDIDSSKSKIVYLSDFIPSTKALRSNQYSLQVIFKTRSLGIIPVYSIKNHEKFVDINVSYDTAYNKFLISYSNRFSSTKLQGSQVIEVKYLVPPVKNEHYIGLSINKDKIKYFIFNAGENFLQGEIDINENVEGAMEFLTRETRFEFFNYSNFKGEGRLTEIKFNYDYALSMDEFMTSAKSTSDITQAACVKGDRDTCQVCKEGKLIGGVCMPDDNSRMFLLNEITPVSRLINSQKTLKYDLANSSNQLNSLTLSFWMKFTSILQINQGIIKLSFGDGKTMNDFYSLVFLPSNAVEIQLKTGLEKKGTRFAESFIYSDILESYDDHFQWINIVIKIDYVNNTHKFRWNCSNSNRNIEKVNEFNSETTPLKVDKNAVVYIKLGFEDKLLSTTDNVSLEYSNIMFTPKDIDRKVFELFRTKKPLACRTPCKFSCINRVCPTENRILNTLNIGNILSGSKDIKQDKDLLYLSKLPLFRPVYSDSGINQSFNYYLISFELDVNAFLSSKYNANKDILLALMNDNRKEYESLSMNDLIPNNMGSLGSLTIKYEDGRLYIDSGYLPWTQELDRAEVPLNRALNEYTKVFFSFLIDTSAKTNRMYVVADNVSYTKKIGTIGFAAPISYYTMIYNHPVLTKINLNLNSPRFDFDLAENAKIHLETEYPSNYCTYAGANCQHCDVSEMNGMNYCLKCKDSFVFYRQSCVSSYYQSQKNLESATKSSEILPDTLTSRTGIGHSTQHLDA
jgi:hypothetical protein